MYVTQKVGNSGPGRMNASELWTNFFTNRKTNFPIFSQLENWIQFPRTKFTNHFTAISYRNGEYTNFLLFNCRKWSRNTKQKHDPQEVAHFSSSACYFDYYSKGNRASTTAHTSTSIGMKTERKQANSIWNHAHEGTLHDNPCLHISHWCSLFICYFWASTVEGKRFFTGFISWQNVSGLSR